MGVRGYTPTEFAGVSRCLHCETLTKQCLHCKALTKQCLHCEALAKQWGCSSVVEHLPFKQVVAGSIPATLSLA